MRRAATALGFALCLGLPAAAQDQTIETTPLPSPAPGFQDGIEGATTEEMRVSVGLGARLKALDKINGAVSEFDMLSGATVQIGKLVVELRECRFPEDNPDGDAFAYLVITEPAKSPDPIFSGWMIASSPALNALDHFRYDIWVLRCKTA